MRIAAMAAGAVGSYFGGRMAAAGHDVHFIARRANLGALRRDGLKIESAHGDLHLPGSTLPMIHARSVPSISSCSQSSFGTPRPPPNSPVHCVGPDTRVITLQNGVDSYERVSGVLGKDAVVPGIVYIAAAMRAPGMMLHTSKFATLRCGTWDGAADPRLDAFNEAAKVAKIDIQLQTDMNASAGRSSSSCPHWPARPASRVCPSARYWPTMTPARSIGA